MASGAAASSKGVPKALDAYRLLFPLGVLYAILAAAVWPLHAAGWIPYPATLHWTLMAQGFLHCFALGFLLTAMPAFLHGEPTRLWETTIAAGAMAVFGAAALAGWFVAAQGAYLATILLTIAAGLRRLPRRRGDPAEEFLFVALGFAFGAVGGVWSTGVAAGWWTDPVPRFSLRLLTEGMMLSVVLGVGGLLVPAFTAMRKPLFIPGVARPGERAPRRALYVAMAALLVASMVLEGMGHPNAAARVRVIPGAVLTLLVWKLFQRPGRSALVSWTLWGGGWLVLLGLMVAAALPARHLLGFHVLSLGGFGLLIMGIATRVVVSHGGHGIAAEPSVLRWDSVAALTLALAARVGAEFAPRSANLHHAVAGLLWIAAWATWGFRASRRSVKRAEPQQGSELRLRTSSGNLIRSS